jgi:hypothetical protein
MSERDDVLAVLPASSKGEIPGVFDRGHKAPNDLWIDFEEHLVALGGQMVPAGALALLVNRPGGVWADDDAMALLPRDTNRAASVWESEVGVCVGDLAIAETGSLVIAAGPGRSRLTSLAPPVNVVLVRADSIVAIPEEAFERLSSATSVIVTGTSRTADIEGVLVRGVHGPRELYVVRLD